MKDQVYAGRDVAAAIRAASEALGVPVASVRYVVLDAGSEPGLGLAGRPAQIAVLLERPRTGDAEVTPDAPIEAPALDPRAGLERALQAFLEAGDLEAAVRIEESERDVVVRVDGVDAGFFLQQEGAVLEALEHVLQRIWLQAGERRRLRVLCQGQGALRDEALRRQARRLAEAAVASGQPQESGPLNAYERRVIHVELSGEAALRTYSVGEGAARRVTVALVEAEPRPKG